MRPSIYVPILSLKLLPSSKLPLQFLIIYNTNSFVKEKDVHKILNCQCLVVPQALEQGCKISFLTCLTSETLSMHMLSTVIKE